MTTSLFRRTWEDMDPYDLRLLLDEHIGGPGQYDSAVTQHRRIYLPLARDACQVAVDFKDHRIVGIQPGSAFDPHVWGRCANAIDGELRSRSTTIGREYSFSSYRVDGWWRGEQSGVQILPPPPGSPVAPVESAEHPFILEFHFTGSPLFRLTNHRRIRTHTRLTLLLNTLLAGRTTTQSGRSAHLWGSYWDEEGKLQTRWVQNLYAGQLGRAIAETLSQPTGEPLPIVASDQYFDVVRGIDGLGLRVPSDLDDSICRYLRLPPDRRDEFERAAYWLEMSRGVWPTSASMSFTALVCAIEALINKRGPGATSRFREFLARHAPEAALESSRNEIYDLRSGLLHGSRLMTLDQGLAFGVDPTWYDQRGLIDQLALLTRVAIRNWLWSR